MPWGMGTLEIDWTITNCRADFHPGITWPARSRYFYTETGSSVQPSVLSLLSSAELTFILVLHRLGQHGADIFIQRFEAACDPVSCPSCPLPSWLLSWYYIDWAITEPTFLYRDWKQRTTLCLVSRLVHWLLVHLPGCPASVITLKISSRDPLITYWDPS